MLCPLTYMGQLSSQSSMVVLSDGKYGTWGDADGRPLPFICKMKILHSVEIQRAAVTIMFLGLGWKNACLARAMPRVQSLATPPKKTNTMRMY